MEHIKNTNINNTTKLIGIKDLNIKISIVLKHQTHIEIKAELDYPAPACPHCQGKMIKYDFQRPATIPILDVQGCLLYTSPSPRDLARSRMPSSA